MYNVLIAFNEMPEDSFFVEKKNIEPLEFELLKSFHEHYVNADEEDEELMTLMTEYFYGTDGVFKHDKTYDIQNGNYDAIIMCGFVN